MAKFQKGNPGGPGGPRPGSGRPPDGLREMCKELISKKKLVERLASIAEGEDIPQPISNGEVIPIPAPVAEQRKAIADLIDRGYGKPDQSIDANISGESISTEKIAGIAGRIAEILALLDGGNRVAEGESEE